MRDHEIAALAHAELAHDAGVRALHHLHDFAVRAPVALHALDADRHAVAVHGAVGVFLAQVDVALAVPAPALRESRSRSRRDARSAARESGDDAV